MTHLHNIFLSYTYLSNDNDQEIFAEKSLQEKIAYIENIKAIYNEIGMNIAP